MEDTRNFLARVSAATPDELATLLLDPTESQELILRQYLGDARFQRMRALAAEVPVAPVAGAERIWPFTKPAEPVRPRLGNVVVLPGLMGSELTTISAGEDRDLVWLNVLRVILGRLSRLRLAADGVSEYDPNYRVEATGLYRRYYGELPIALARSWNVREFSFDWRRGLDQAADALRLALDRWFGPDTPAHLVAHSMGGLVCRTFIARHPDRWKSLWDRGAPGRPPGTQGGRLVMLGTPNHGSYLIPQAITGRAATVRLIERFDQWHDMNGLLAIINSFVGSYQMLPSPYQDSEAEFLYDPKTYRGIGRPEVTPGVLESALQHHKLLRGIIDTNRMVYVAGDGQTTADGIKDRARFHLDDAAYTFTTRGDGSVSHRLGELDGVKSYYVASEHSALTSNPDVLGALDALLQGHKPAGLSERPAAGRRAAEVDSQAVAREQEAALNAELARADELVRRLDERGRVAVAVAPEVMPAGMAIAPDAAEAEAEAMLGAGLLGTARPVVVGHAPAPAPPVTPVTTLHIRTVAGDILQAHRLPAVTVEQGRKTIELPVDAILVGLYEGSRPEGVTLALDHAISEALPGGARPAKETSDEPERDLLLTQYADRGIIRGALAQPFWPPDPRDRDGRRLVVVQGLGRPGRCGVPELTVAVREACWAIGRTGRRHLAAPLIGSGKGNLDTPQAVEGWLRGLAAALSGADSPDRKIDVLTLYTRGRAKHAEIRELLDRARVRTDLGPIRIVLLDGIEEPQTKQAPSRRGRRTEAALRRRRRETTVQLTVSLGTDPKDPRLGIYQYGALTTDATITERSIPLDASLVEELNDALPGVGDPRRQLELGRLLNQLLIPDDLREGLRSDAPIVLQLDANTARIHWEMVAQPEATATLTDEPPITDGFDEMRFLGTARGLTRQLRTSFAGPPEPPPPPIRTLRVLIVADPAEDAPLPGARAEGRAVARLFEAYNRIHSTSPNRIEVEALLGPGAADRIEVLNRLTTRRYHVLHFAGHCFFDKERPARSGWLFGKDRILSAYELQRIDRVPPFVFSNACESGVTPDRARQRVADLVPSFAEAFFARGVSNFVATAWPIDDLAAVRFATTLYGQLLNLEPLGPDGDAGPGPPERAPAEMYTAMREARLALAKTGQGQRTWGAYQHYGNPYHRLVQDSHQTAPRRKRRRRN